MRRQTKLRKLDRRLDAVQGKIDQHLFSSERVKRAQEYSQSREAEGASPQEIDAELSEQDLPSLRQLGAWTLTRMWGWGWLHNRRRRLQRRVDRLELMVGEEERRSSGRERNSADS